MKIENTGCDIHKAKVVDNFREYWLHVQKSVSSIMKLDMFF